MDEERNYNEDEVGDDTDGIYEQDESEYVVLDESEQKAMPSKFGKTVARELLEWAQAIIIAVVIALLIKNFVFTVAKVKGPSMQPTLQDGNRLFVQILLFEPEYGDIIIFKPHCSPDSLFVKRVIANEGQTLDINFTTGDVTVDGVVLDEPYIADRTRRPGDMQFPTVVPDGCVFAMGDNRNSSHDSRSSDVGFIKKSSIIGGAKFRIWPFDKIGALKFE